jgi:hypothetical protein
MAITVASVSGLKDEKVGNLRFCTRDITFDNSYPTGGYAVTKAQAGMNAAVRSVLTDAGAKNAAGTSAVPVRYDYTNNKLQAYRYDGASAGKAFLEEVANAVDLSTFTVRVTFVGQ